ncbi:MAG TPA: hypothetical protein VGB26_01595 [Nitrospiria bacterium]|jgi:hypothetical protein
MLKNPYLINGTIFLIALVGFISVLFATHIGVGISPDSTGYIEEARNLLDGFGISQISNTGKVIPISVHPPLFQTLIAIIGFFDIDLAVGARWINAFFFGANIVLAGLIIQQHVRSSWYPSILATFIILISVDLLHIHSMAWTEPSFIFWGILGIYLLAKHIENQSRVLLMASASAIALACLSRYPGVTLIATGVAGIIFLSRKPLKERMFDSLIFGFISSVPLILWLSRNMFIEGTPTSHPFGFHPITLQHIKTALHTFSFWIFPSTNPNSLIGASLLVMLVVLPTLNILQIKRKNMGKGYSFQDAIGVVPFLGIIFVVIYFIFLISIISLFNLWVQPEKRILSIVHVFSVITIACIAYNLAKNCTMSGPAIIFIIVASMPLAAHHLRKSVNWVIHTHNNGLGYTSKFWANSQFIQHVKLLPANSEIFTNAPDLVNFLTTKRTWIIPFRIDPQSGLKGENYEVNLARFREKLRNNNNTFLVYFNPLSVSGVSLSRPFMASEKDIIGGLPFEAIYSGSEGTIYKRKE